jgi:S1-C subfamily serine protease
MSAKIKSIVLLVVVVTSFAIWGVVAAQENTDNERPFLGVQLENLDDSATVRDVVVDSAAAAAGLEEGDVITTINGTEVSSAREVAELIAALNPGDTATIGFTRDGEASSVEVTLGSAPARPSVNLPFMFHQGGDLSLSYDATNQTWHIQDLSEESALYEAGLRAGDTITAINGEQYDPMSLREFLADQSENVTVTVERDGESQDIEVPATALDILGFGGGFRFGEGRGMPFGEGRGYAF